MRIGLIFCANEEHRYPKNEYHPEQKGRVLNAEKFLSKKYVSNVYKANNYSEEEILNFLSEGGHNREHFEKIKKGFENNNSAYSYGELSYNACIEECKCLMTMCDLIIKNKIDYAINVIRPPGHHCCNNKPGGFCLINTAILASKKLLKKYKKVNILDVDLHHGGGTQKMMEKEKNISYNSIHNKNVWSDGLYPKGINGKRERIINIALNHSANDKDYIYTTNYLISEMEKFTKEMLILSLGFDAHKDEIGVGKTKTHNMSLTTGYYGQLGNLLSKKFKKLFIILEGGYNENVIKEGLYLFIEGIMGRKNFILEGELKQTTIEKIEKIDKITKKIDLK